jgi:two-component system response regulator NreC
MTVLNKITLAIAEDHELYREGLISRLKGENHIEVVGQFENGLELLKYLENNRVDIVLMDIKMPLMNGIIATQQILHKKMETKVIALTMYDNDNSLIDMLTAGASGYLLKNENFSEIISVINDVYDGKKAYSKKVHTKILELISKDKYHPHSKGGNIDISPLELEIIKLICKSFSAKEIAEILKMSFRTIEGYKSRILTKFDVKSTTGIVVHAIKNKLVDINDL